jgi:hypothetical protein
MAGSVEFDYYGVAELKSSAMRDSLDQKNAMSYVDRVRTNHDMAAIYKKNGEISDLQLHGLAYHDFITPPRILGIFCEKYLSHRARPIIIRTKKDDVGVRQVMVKIFNSNGELLEKGSAKHFFQNEKWFYFVRKEIKGQQEIRIEVKAVDYPGNLTVFTQWLGV